MKILIPVAAPVSYNPAYYLKTAFTYYGIDVQVIDQTELYSVGVNDADLIVGVDSGGPLNIPDHLLSKSVMWFIDSRRNHKPEIRTPDDDTTGLRILAGGGHVLQAQVEDAQRFCKLTGTNERLWRAYYMPIGVDTLVWSDSPCITNPEWQAAFVGNCYDTVRLDALNDLSSKGLLHWPGIEGAIAEQGAAVYRNAVCGLNIPSWYGTPECYDLNMRVFEIASCGRLLITNYVNGLFELGFEEGKHYISYSNLSEIPDIITAFNGVDRKAADAMGSAVRKFIVMNHTYLNRAYFMLAYWERDWKLGS